MSLGQCVLPLMFILGWAWSRMLEMSRYVTFDSCSWESWCQLWWWVTLVCMRISWGLITRVGSWAVASGILPQTGPRHLPLQPDPWLGNSGWWFWCSLHFEGGWGLGGEVELESEEIKSKNGNQPGPGSLDSHFSWEVGDLRQPLISGSKCGLRTKG